MSRKGCAILCRARAKTSSQPNDAQGPVATNPNEGGAQDSNRENLTPANQDDLFDLSTEDPSLTSALQPDEQSDLNAAALEQPDAGDQTLNLNS